jgi:transaldolase
MILFLDTADLTEIKKYAPLIDGVTTTPTIIKRAGLSSDEFISRVRSSFPLLDIHIEALGKTAGEIEAVVEDYCQRPWYDATKIAFKIPIGKEGLEATGAIKRKNPTVRVNLHMVFSAAQAILAMHAKADFVAPLIGRYTDRIADLSNHGRRAKNNDAGYDMLGSIMACKRSMRSGTVILASSIRTVYDFVSAIELGCDAVTLPPRIFEEALNHPMTDEGVEQFWRDHDRAAV